MKINRLKRISFDTPQKVYDLTVPKYHNFKLSSGPVVHNSKDIADSFVGSIWLASKSSISLRERYAESDTKDLLSTMNDRPTQEGLMNDVLGSDRRVVNNLNDLARLNDQSGILDIFGRN